MRNKFLKTILYILIISLLLGLSFSCSKEEEKDFISETHMKYLDVPEKEGNPTVIEFFAEW